MRSAVEKSSGLVIHVVDYQDNAVIATIFSSTGVNNYIVKGAKKTTTSTRKLANPLTLISFNHTTNKTLQTLIEGDVINNYTDIKANLEKYQAVSIILEDLYHFLEGINDYKTIYDFTMDILDLINNSAYYESYVMIFEIKLLYLLGVSPRLSSCCICGNKINQGGLSIKYGGLICENCGFNYRYNLDCNDSLIFIKAYRTKLNNIDENQLKELNKQNIKDFIEKYYEYHLDFKSKVKRVIHQLEKKEE